MIKKEILNPEKLIISLNEYLLKCTYLEKLEKIEKINQQFIEDEKIAKKFISLDSSSFINKSLINCLFYTLEANISFINQILLGLGEKFFSNKEKEILNKNKNNRLFFSNMDIFSELDDFFIKTEIEKVLIDTISLFNKFYDYNLVLNNLHTFITLITKIRVNYLKNEITITDCSEIINASKGLFGSIEEIIKKINIALNDFKIRKYKGGSFEIKLSKDAFKEIIKYKKENWESNDDSDYFLCNMIGENLCSSCENLKDLSKPLMNAYLIWYFFWEYINGGLSQVFYNSMGDYASEISEALMDIGLKKEAQVLKGIVDQYYNEMNKKIGKIINFREFFHSYGEFDLTKENEVFNECERLYIKADKYLMKNREDFCI